MTLCHPGECRGPVTGCRHKDGMTHTSLQLILNDGLKQKVIDVKVGGQPVLHDNMRGADINRRMRAGLGDG